MTRAPKVFPKHRLWRGPNRPLFTRGGPPNYVQNSLAAAAQPFKGITVDGSVIPGLFPLQKTGVSTESIRQAAADFLGSLTLAQLAPNGNDYGKDLLRQHYETGHHAK